MPVASPIRQGVPSAADHVDAGDLGFLAAALGEARHDQRVVVAAQHRADALVEPLGRDADLAGRRPPALDAGLEHPQAVGQLGRRGLLRGRRVHRVAIAGAAEVGEAGARDDAARRLGRVIDRRQQPPRPASGVDLVVVEGVPVGAALHQPRQRRRRSRWPAWPARRSTRRRRPDEGVGSSTRATRRVVPSVS